MCVVCVVAKRLAVVFLCQRKGMFTAMLDVLPTPEMTSAEKLAVLRAPKPLAEQLRSGRLERTVSGWGTASALHTKSLFE